MTEVYFGLGSNLGNKKQLLSQAIALLQQEVGALQRVSSFIETQPWGFDSPHTFLNAVACFTTSLTSGEVLRTTQRIERHMGRTAKSHAGQYCDRPIDIDLLLYGTLVGEYSYRWPESGDAPVMLVLPHPFMHQRTFVLEPLAEIAPHLQHPVLHRTMSELLDELQAQ